MALADKYTLKNLMADFPTDEACLEAIFDALHTRQCSCGGTYAKISGRKQYQCSQCRFQIHKSDTPLKLWFHAIFVWSHVKRSIAGTHKHVSRRHLQSYVDGFVFHRNNRHNDSQRFAVLLGTLLSSRPVEIRPYWR